MFFTLSSFITSIVVSRGNNKKRSCDLFYHTVCLYISLHTEYVYSLTRSPLCVYVFVVTSEILAFKQKNLFSKILNVANIVSRF